MIMQAIPLSKRLVGRRYSVDPLEVVGVDGPAFAADDDPPILHEADSRLPNLRHQPPPGIRVRADEGARGFRWADRLARPALGGHGEDGLSIASSATRIAPSSGARRWRPGPALKGVQRVG